MEFKDLFNKLSPVIKRIGYKAAGRSHDFGHDDLYQEALLHLWSSFRQGELAGKTDSYILQGCYFHLKNYLRKNKRNTGLVSLDSLKNAEGEDIDLDRIIPACGRSSLRDQLHCSMLIEQINNNGLRPREKEVFNFLLAGLTIREIALKLGVSHVMVIKLKKTMLKKCLEHIDKI